MIFCEKSAFPASFSPVFPFSENLRRAVDKFPSGWYDGINRLKEIISMFTTIFASYYYFTVAG